MAAIILGDGVADCALSYPRIWDLKHKHVQRLVSNLGKWEAAGNNRLNGSQVLGQGVASWTTLCFSISFIVKSPTVTLTLISFTQLLCNTRSERG